MTTTGMHVRFVLKALDAIGADRPTRLAAVLDDADRIRAAATSLSIDAPPLVAAALDALAAGRDPLTDKAVLRAVVGEQLRAANLTGPALAVALDERAAAAVREDQHAILDALRAAAAEAGATLTAAHAVLGNLELTDADRVAYLGPNAVEHWQAARSAAATLDAVLTGWRALAELTRFAHPNTPVTQVLADMGMNVPTGPGASKPDAWTLVRHGATIDLADGPAVAARKARIKAEQDERTRAQASTDPWRNEPKRRAVRVS